MLSIICYLLQIKLPLNLLGVTGVIGDGFRQFSLNVGQPGPQAAHILIELLHSHQCLSQLLHSINIVKTGQLINLFIRTNLKSTGTD